MGSLEDFFEDKDQEITTRVAYDEQEDVCVSTIFMALDLNFWGSGPPIVFETMIFGGPYDQNQERCSTYEDALLMHHRAVLLAFGEEQKLLES